MPKAVAAHHMSLDVNCPVAKSTCTVLPVLPGTTQNELTLPFADLHVSGYQHCLSNTTLTMASNSIVGAPSTINPQPQSRLLSIPGETRRLILQQAVPSNTHLILDPESRESYEEDPQRVSYGSIAALLRVSKQIY